MRKGEICGKTGEAVKKGKGSGEGIEVSSELHREPLNKSALPFEKL